MRIIARSKSVCIKSVRNMCSLTFIGPFALKTIIIDNALTADNFLNTNVCFNLHAPSKFVLVKRKKYFPDLTRAPLCAHLIIFNRHALLVAPSSGIKHGFGFIKHVQYYSNFWREQLNNAYHLAYVCKVFLRMFLFLFISSASHRPNCF